MTLSDYKKEILGAVIGALFAAALSLSIGLYNLNKSFELTQKKELLFSLRTDITLLRNVERELDENLNLFLNHDYKISIETEEVKIPEFPVEDKEDEEFVKQLTQYLENLHGKLFKVTKIQYPLDKFVADAWKPSGPTVSDIDFELIQMLNDFYRKLLLINKFIKGAQAISKDMILIQSQLNTTKNTIPHYNKKISEITQKKIIDLKNKIAKEVNRLQKERSKISY